jgi:lipopolysaccharide/colanic/teichoic acid biosynthesis glycosyltransferase
MKAPERTYSMPHTSVPYRVQHRFHPSTRSWLKRSIDLIGSLIGLLVLAMIFIPLVLLIRLDSRGPIFYTQERYGLHGKIFHIRKFRSMVTNADAIKHLVPNEANGLIFKNRQDPRVTRVGRILRKTSLDEFPQFWNVLVGEMSLVGTRPPTHDEVRRYEPHHWNRLDVKPGITGEWQVHGRSSVLDFEQVVQLDLRYQQRWSVFYDLRLICQTLSVVVTGHGAY